MGSLIIGLAAPVLFAKSADDLGVPGGTTPGAATLLVVGSFSADFSFSSLHPTRPSSSPVIAAREPSRGHRRAELPRRSVDDMMPSPNGVRCAQPDQRTVK